MMVSAKRRNYLRPSVRVRAFGWLIGIMVLFSVRQPVQGQGVMSSDLPTTTPIKHIIMLMQENHSFDNYFGTYPGANGIPDDACMPLDPFDTTATTCVKPFHIGDVDVELHDPDHSSTTSHIQYNDGLMNGFIYALNLRNQDGRLAMGYYDGRDLPYYWNIADEYVLFDNLFSSVAGGSSENHMYWIAANIIDEPEGPARQAALAQMPTIFDRLEAAGISWKFYVQNYDSELNYRTLHLYPGNRASQVIWVPLLNFDRFIDNPTLASHIVDLGQYYDDLINGTLPNVAFIAPSGPSEHPPSSILSGQRFVRTLIQSLIQSSYWEQSAFMWAYDDWGGWYDHVLPPQVDEHGYGFRVPALLVSAYAKQGYIDHTQLDFTSMLKFIEENWKLEPLAQRDAQANSIINAFDFSQPPRTARFIPFVREANAGKKAPVRSAIFITYGAALAFAVGIIIVAIARSGPKLRSPREAED